MDVLNKLKNAVSSALPGNPLSKDFEVYGQIGTGGPGLLWKIYAGMKRTTKQDAAVFLFEKKSIEKYSRRDKEFILDALRRGASQLTRLRHPKILSVMQPLEESRESLAFATEPVLASLANTLGILDNIPESVAKELKEYKLYDIEIKYGLLQVTEAIQFLHQDVKLLHNNICPESVIINKNGAWKLAGFDFCIQNKSPPEQAPVFTYKEWEPDIPPCAQPNLDFMAPEYAITESCSLACDMFSEGMLIYAVFNNGKPLYVCNNQLTMFRKNVEELRKWRGTLLGKLPKELQDIVKLLFNTEPTVRPDPDQLAKINFFEDVGSMTLQYMDTLFQQDSLPKSKFFKGLPKIIVKFPKRVNLQRMLPPLLKECVNPDMIPFVLPNILQIAEQATDKEYNTLILPDLIPMFKLTSPVQILLIFLKNMSLLLKKTSATDINTHVLPMIYRALESDNPQIQELSLNIIPSFADKIDYKALKISIVPRIKKLCLTTTILEVRVKCLLCLGKMLESMDKWFVLDEVLPLLPQIPSREAAVLMSILGVYKVALAHEKLGITKDMLAGTVIPFLITVSTEHSLSLGQFTAYMTLIREMVDKVEREHRSKLVQLEQMKQEQKNMEITKITEEDGPTLISGIDEKPKTMMDSFLSNYSVPASDGRKSHSSAGSSVNPTSEAYQAKVTLSLEEKERIAKQQEQQRYLKAAKPMEAKPLGTNTFNKPSQLSTQPKDLTGSLMQSKMVGLNLSASSSSIDHSNLQGQKLLNGQKSLYSNSSSGSFGSRTSAQNMNYSGLSLAGGHLFPQKSHCQGSSNTPGNKPVDLSAFDNLLSNNSNAKKMPTGDTYSSSGASVTASNWANTSYQGMVGSGSNQTMMGKSNPGMMGNMSTQGMMGNMSTQGMMGNMSTQGMMGNMSNQGNIGISQAMIGQHGMTDNLSLTGQQAMNNMVRGSSTGQDFGGRAQFQQQTVGQTSMQPQTFSNQPSCGRSAKNDLEDLFG